MWGGTRKNDKTKAIGVFIFCFVFFWVFLLKTSLGCLLLTFHVSLGFVSLLACGGWCLGLLGPRGGCLLGCFLLQHRPVKRVVVLVVQGPTHAHSGHTENAQRHQNRATQFSLLGLFIQPLPS